MNQGDPNLADRQLGQELRRIEKEYLNERLNSNQKAIPELVSYLTQQLILPTLRQHLADVAYTGSAYEYTTVPGKSDFDIQFYIALPSRRENHQRIHEARAEHCGNPGWRRVAGGAQDLLDDTGYMSTAKARTLILRGIDRAVSQQDLKFRDSEAIIRRSVSGPATTLNVLWRNESISIDVVVCLQARDVDGSEHDLVGKPYDGRDSQPTFWRLSYSNSELQRLREFHRSNPRMLILLRIMKVIKQHNSQLGHFPSYFYKNILFMLSERKSDAGWERSDLAQRFKDMIELIMNALDDQYLPVYFNKEVNYLSDYSVSKIKEVANYLKGIIRNNRYLQLLEQVPRVRSGWTLSDEGFGDGSDELVRGFGDLEMERRDARPANNPNDTNDPSSCNIL